MTPPLDIALLFGGRSGEHEVSLLSAASVGAALLTRHRVLPVLIDHDGRFWLQSGAPEASGGEAVFLVPSPSDRGCLRRVKDGAVVARPHVYFPVLHGTYGEDGTVQGLLDLAAVPYVGAGCAASAAGMDKELMKGLFAASGIPQTAYRAFRRGELAGAEDVVAEAFGWPVFVKPANLGSSVGVSKVIAPEGLAAALALALRYDRKLLVEQAVDAREIEVSLLGNDAAEASLPGEIVPDRDYYDYDSKYSSGSSTRLVIPAALPGPVVEQARALALRAFRAIDACGFARVDLFLDRATGRLLVNEINTIPGFTAISMFPKLWEASGIAYPALVDRLVKLGLERHAERAGLLTHRV